MDYKKVERSISAIIGDKEQILTVFEHSFRDTISGLDMQILASGNIPSKIISTCIANALQAASKEANALGCSSIAVQLWNPLTACLVQQVAAPTSTFTLSKPPTLEKPSSTKKVVVKGKSASKDKPVEPEFAEKIRCTLKLNKKSSGFFNNAYHNHVSCVKPDCQFCCNLYQQVNITKCSGHKACHPCGYYPHVGKTLWKILKGRHDKGESCKLKNKPCSTSEIQNLAFETQRGHNDNVDYENELDGISNLSWAEQSELDNSFSEKEPIFYPKPRKAARRSSTPMSC